MSVFFHSTENIPTGTKSRFIMHTVLDFVARAVCSNGKEQVEAADYMQEQQWLYETVTGKVPQNNTICYKKLVIMVIKVFLAWNRENSVMYKKTLNTVKRQTSHINNMPNFLLSNNHNWSINWILPHDRWKSLHKPDSTFKTYAWDLMTADWEWMLNICHNAFQK